MGTPFWTVQEHPPDKLGKNEVFFNALAKSAPECNRVDNNKDGESGKLDKCYVYCAQRTCKAAEKFMRQHERGLREQCKEVVYLKGGALCMNKDKLIDGEKCHRDIAEYNKKQSGEETKPCYQCDADKGVDVGLVIDGVETQASLLENEKKPPAWYPCAGIAKTQRLPLQFQRSKYEPRKPQTHDVKDGALYRLDISNTDIHPNAYLAVWASEPSKGVLPAHEAYGSFDNSGIAKCVENLCTFRLRKPSSYTANGKVYKPHIHLVDHDGKKWNEDVRTLTTTD